MSLSSQQHRYHHYVTIIDLNVKTEIHYYTQLLCPLTTPGPGQRLVCVTYYMYLWLIMFLLVTAAWINAEVFTMNCIGNFGDK